MKKYDIITSNNNPLVKRLSKLEDSKYRKSEGLFLCEGRKLSDEALRLGRVKYLVVSDNEKEANSDIITLAESENVEVIILSESPFGKISTEKAPQGIIAVCETNHITDGDGTPVRGFVCDGVRDPGNLGTIFRTAAAMGFNTVYVSDCADIYNSKTVRASMGGIFRLKIIEIGDIIEKIGELRKNGKRVFATALAHDSKVFGSFSLSESDIFVVGNEGHGLSEEIIRACSDSVYIEMSADTESLNVSAASAVIMWEMSKVFGK